MKAIDSGNEALAIVESDSASFGSAWVEMVPKSAALIASPTEFRIAMRNRLLFRNLKSSRTCNFYAKRSHPSMSEVFTFRNVNAFIGRRSKHEISLTII